MEKITDILSSIPSFSGLSETQIGEIRQIAVDRHFAKGEIIFFQGDEGNGFYIIISGMVKIFKVSPEGKEHIMRIVTRGEPFGQVAVYAGRAFPASAQAIAKSHLLFLPRTEFVQLINHNPSLALSMLANLSMRLREFTVHVENLALKEVPGRLAAYLIHLAEEQRNKGDMVSLNISKVQLSSLLGTTPETLSRILTQMQGRGLIEVKRRDIRILDHPGLEELAEHGKILPE
ncbi:MAG: cyclic nucleotide-binding domain-containing protein [Dehalococcoidia bacterium]|nr:cyclic nucleotide-binding domain-containing protein [Dehalococcoidia bacterium]